MKPKIVLPSISSSSYYKGVPQLATSNTNGNVKLHSSLKLSEEAERTANLLKTVIYKALEKYKKWKPEELSFRQRRFINAIEALNTYYDGRLFEGVVLSQEDNNGEPRQAETSSSSTTLESGIRNKKEEQRNDSTVTQDRNDSLAVNTFFLSLFGLDDFEVKRFDVEGELSKLQKYFGVINTDVPNIVENNKVLHNKGAGGAYSFKNHELHLLTDADSITAMILNSIPASFGSMKPSFHRLGFLVPDAVKKLALKVVNERGMFKNIMSHEYTHSTQGAEIIKNLTTSDIEEVTRWYVEKLDKDAKRILLLDKNIKEMKGDFSNDDDTIVKYLTGLFPRCPKTRTAPISEEQLAASKYLLLGCLETMLLADPRFRNGSQGLLQYTLNPLEMEARLGASAYAASDVLRADLEKSDLVSPKAFRVAQGFLFEVAANDHMLKVAEMKRNGVTEEEIKQEEDRFKALKRKGGLEGAMNTSNTLLSTAKKLERKENKPKRFQFVDKWIDKAEVIEKKISGRLGTLKAKFVSLLPEALRRRLSG